MNFKKNEKFLLKFNSTLQFRNYLSWIVWKRRRSRKDGEKSRIIEIFEWEKGKLDYRLIEKKEGSLKGAILRQIECK